MKAIKLFSAFFVLTTILVSCGASEKFVQDDVYTSKTPIVPLGTDLNDATDYAAYVQKKQNSNQKTVYSSRDLFDMQYRSYFGYFVGMGGYGTTRLSFGFTPGDPWSLRYSNFNSLNRYPYYPGYSYYGGYYSGPYGFYNSYYGYYGNYFNYGNYGNYGYMYNPYYGYGGYNNPYYYNGYGYGASGNSSWGQQTHKPTSNGNTSSASAGSSSGRYGSNGNGGTTYYQNGMKQSTNIPASARQTDTYSTTPIRSASSSGPRTPVRPTSSMSNSTYSNGTYNSGSTTTSGRTTPSVNAGRSNSDYVSPRTRIDNSDTYRNNTGINTGRTSSPSFNSSPSSGGAVGGGGRTSGGSVSGGRR